LLSPFRRKPLDMLLGRWTLDSRRASWPWTSWRACSRAYELNPAGINPLREILADLIDFDRLARAPIKLFVTATKVRIGRGRIFRNADVTPDALLASACLPTMSTRSTARAIGTVAIPAIPRSRRSCGNAARTIRSSSPINPVERPGTPRTARDILNRLNDVSFNAVLLKELRMIALLRQMATPGNGEGALLADMRIHLVRSDPLMELGYSSKLNAEWEFFRMLRDSASTRASNSSRRTAMTSGAVRASTSTCCSKASERMGLLITALFPAYSEKMGSRSSRDRKPVLSDRCESARVSA
jgi:NTE family protein